MVRWCLDVLKAIGITSQELPSSFLSVTSIPIRIPLSVWCRDFRSHKSSIMSAIFFPFLSFIVLFFFTLSLQGMNNYRYFFSLRFIHFPFHFFPLFPVHR